MQAARRAPTATEAACRAIIIVALTGRDVSSDDVAEINDGERRRTYVGAAMRSLHQAGILQPVGWRPSTVPRNHARPILMWRLANADAARAWLADHPLPLPPGPVVQRRLPLGDDA